MRLASSWRGLFACFACHFVCVAVAEGQTSTTRVASGLSSPIFANSPTGDSRRLFIAEQGSSGSARIKVLDRNTGSVLAAPYLTISGLTTGGEQGLLGMAFHPEFATNGYFYVYLSVPGGPWNHKSEIRRYRALGNPMTSDVASTLASDIQTVLTFDQPESNHNGGWIGFNPRVQPTDPQYLYIASGDGGGGNDTGGNHTPLIGNAQDTTNNLLGKILRIDVNSDDFPQTDRNYGIPANNPFVGQTGDDEIWSYGLRNPYRSSFDRRTADLWMGDVGQGAREEIDFQPASSSGGENYGWRLREGTIPTPGSVGGPPPPGNVEPVYDYEHVGGPFGGNVVIGGYVYRGSVAAYEGHYFFADAGSNNIWTLDPWAQNIPSSVQNRNAELVPNVGSLTSIGSFGEDEQGELHLVSLNGGVYKIVSTSRTVEWNGTSATAGVAGDGINFSDARNWTRAGVVDVALVAEDHVVFRPGSSVSTVDMNGNRTVGAVTFAASYALGDAGDVLTVLSGNVTVEAGVTATAGANLQAETVNSSLRKRGTGTLVVGGQAGQMVVFEGTLAGNGTINGLRLEGGMLAPGGASGSGGLAAPTSGFPVPEPSLAMGLWAVVLAMCRYRGRSHYGPIT